MEINPLKNNISFTKKWWDNFLEETQMLKKTTIFKDCMDKEETTLLRKYILQVLQTLAELRTDKYGYRVYVDGKLLDAEAMNEIYDSPPLNNEGVREWTERVFIGKKFGMIINLGEKFNLKLSKNIALKTQPYLKKIGFPRDGVNFSIFIGNYKQTPLGIHKDPPGQDVMHFHLGPGKKTMYTWSKNKYENLIKNNKFKKQDIKGLTPLSTEYTFKEGDMYFMTEGEYHIGMQEDLSMAVTFWRYNHSRQILLRNLSTSIINQFLQNGEDVLNTDKNPLEDISGIEESLDLLKIPDETANLNFKDLIRNVYKDSRYCINSNAGYRTNPLPFNKGVLLNKKDLIQIEEPYRILYKKSISKNKLDVFIRGTKIELNNFDCIKLLIDKINMGKSILVSDLLNILDKEWNEKTGLYILNLFFENHGIIKLS